MNKKKWMIIIACVVVLAAIVYALMGGKKETPVMDYETARVEKATIGNSVTATGTRQDESHERTEQCEEQSGGGEK